MVLMPHWPKVWPASSVKYDLNNMYLLLSALSFNCQHLPPVIHVAGTNGKGSTCAYLKAIFEAAKMKVHMFTSPHLVQFNERITISSEQISNDYLFQLLERVRIASDKIAPNPSFFEATCAAALIGFAKEKADVLILETGIGGLLDATNVIAKPLITIITPISFDHMTILGNTISQIASAKAGIIKQNTPCVISAQTPEALSVLLDTCYKSSSPAIVYEYDFGIMKNDGGFKFVSKEREIMLPLPSLPGEHQLLNAASVIASLVLAQKQFVFTDQQLAQGLLNVYWPARIEKIPSHKYSQFCHNQIWVDGAHNDHGAKVLANWAEQNLPPEVVLIIGITKNRNIVSFLQQFNNLCARIYAVPVISEPSSYTSQELSSAAIAAGINVVACLCLQDALTKISNELPTSKIIITGSLFLAADFFKLIGTHNLHNEHNY